MRVLALDASGAEASIAVRDDVGELIFQRDVASPRGRGGAIFPVLADAMRVAGCPDRIAVGLGPGAYNGLRVAVAAAEGIALACGADRVGVLSLRAIGTECREYVCIGDARGGLYYFAKLSDRKLVGEIELLSRDAMSGRLGQLQRIAVFATAPVDAFPDVARGSVDAAILASLASTENPAGAALEPIYLKPPCITAPRVRRISENCVKAESDSHKGAPSGTNAIK